MNLFLKQTSFVIFSALVVLSGCTKKPKRPDPSATMIGQQGGAGGLGGAGMGDLGATDASAAGLEGRDGVIETDDKIIGLLQPVYFDYDKSAIREPERAKIVAAKDYLAANPQYRILFEGHCDWRGTSEYNLSLGDRRANAAKEYLQSLGVPANKIETLSKGSMDAREGDESSMAKDRRAEIVVLKK